MGKDREEIVNSFWKNIYRDVADGGYISNDELLGQYRFLVEKKELIGFIERYILRERRCRALDIGCGNGRFTELMSNYFEQVDAIDISEDIIFKNIEKNRKSNCNYYNKSLEEFASKIDFDYDFIYIGGVLMYIEDDKISDTYKALSHILKRSGTLILRESVMTRERVDNISERYIAFYRQYDDYSQFLSLEMLDKKENLAYRTSELRTLFGKLRLGFLFNENHYDKLLPLLKVKDILWKPKMNRLVNYYYVFRGRD